MRRVHRRFSRVLCSRAEGGGSAKGVVDEGWGNVRGGRREEGGGRREEGGGRRG